MRNLFVLAAMAAVVAVLVVLGMAQGRPTSATVSPVSYWPFDDGLDPTEDEAGTNDGTLGTGTTVDPSDPAYEVSDNGGTDIAPVPGNVDALVFDGDDDFVNVDGLVADVSSNTEGTISLWVKFNSGVFGDSGNIFTVSKGDITNYLQINVDAKTDRLRFVLFDASFVTNKVTTATFADAYHHVAVTSDGSTTRFYVDGVEPTLITNTDSGKWFNDLSGLTSARIGGIFFGGLERSFGGKIDEVCIWDRALNATEIADLEQGVPCVPSPVEPACSTVVRNTVNVVGKDRPFKKGALEGARVIMLAKDTVHTVLGIQNLLDAPAVWAAFDALPLAQQPEAVFLKDSNGLATVESFTPDADGWAIYEDALGGSVNLLEVTGGATQRAVAISSDCAPSKHMQWIATAIDGDPVTLNITSARQQNIKGSLLTILYPEETVWDQGTQLYPFIFTSDSDWTVDVCAEVPVGYDIVGAYDENGDLMTDSACAQTFVTGEVKVVAFDVVDIGSPEPVLGALLTVEHKGKVTEVDIEIPGERTYVEEPAAQPAELPTTGADPGSDGTPVWLAAAAFTGIAALLLGSFVVWRRRRA